MISANRHAFAGLVPEQCLRWITPQESADNWRRTISPGGMAEGDCLLVAEHESSAEVVGFALARVRRGGGDDRAAGELQVIAVSPAFQLQGVGRRLVRAVAAHLASVGVSSMLVRVLSVNPNRTFYERLGARFLREEPRDWNGVVLPESVYEWAELSPLLSPGEDD